MQLTFTPCVLVLLHGEGCAASKTCEVESVSLRLLWDHTAWASRFRVQARISRCGRASTSRWHPRRMLRTRFWPRANVAFEQAMGQEFGPPGLTARQLPAGTAIAGCAHRGDWRPRRVPQPGASLLIWVLAVSASAPQGVHRGYLERRTCRCALFLSRWSPSHIPGIQGTDGQTSSVAQIITRLHDSLPGRTAARTPSIWYGKHQHPSSVRNNLDWRLQTGSVQRPRPWTLEL